MKKFIVYISTTHGYERKEVEAESPREAGAKAAASWGANPNGYAAPLPSWLEVVEADNVDRYSVEPPRPNLTEGGPTLGEAVGGLAKKLLG